MSQTISNNLSVANSITSNNLASSTANIQNLTVSNLSVSNGLTTNSDIICNNINSAGSISCTSLSIPNLNLTSLNLNGSDLNIRISNIETKNNNQDTSINTLNTNVSNNTTSINTLQTKTTGIIYSSPLTTTVIDKLQVTNQLTHSSIIEDSFIINSSNYNQVFYEFPLHRNYILLDNQPITLRFPQAPSFAIGQIIKIKRINYSGVKDNIGTYEAQFGTGISIDSSYAGYLNLTNSFISTSSSTVNISGVNQSINTLISNIDCFNYDISLYIESTTSYKLLINNVLTNIYSQSLYTTNIHSSNQNDDQINVIDVINFNDVANFDDVANFNDLVKMNKPQRFDYLYTSNTSITVNTSNLYPIYLVNANTQTTLTLSNLGSSYNGTVIEIRCLADNNGSIKIQGNGATIRDFRNNNGTITSTQQNYSKLIYMSNLSMWVELVRS